MEINFKFNYNSSNKTYNNNYNELYEKLKTKMLEDETFKEYKIKGYFVTTKGRIFSIKQSQLRELNPSYNNGYKQVILIDNNKRITKTVHRLVAETFIVNTNSDIYTQINHKDENRTNNNVENLEWCSAKYNTVYSQGKRIKCTLKVDGKLIGYYESTHEAARQLNLLQGEIVNVLKHRRGQTSTKGYCFEYV